MAEFSYEADIAPMRGSFFSDSNLNDRERRQLQTDYMQKIAPYQEITNKTLERMIDVQNQDLAFKRANTAFEEEKLKLQEARDAAAMYPKISTQLEAAMSGKDPNDQRILVADVMMQHPTFFETKSGSALISAVNSKISAGATAKAAENAKTSQLWSMAAQMGMPDLAEKVNTGTLSNDDTLKQMIARKNELEKLEKQREESDKITKAEREAQEKNIARYDSMYRNVKVVGKQDTFDGKNKTAVEGGESSLEVLPSETKFTDFYREDVIGAIADLSGLTVKQIKEKAEKDKLSDVALRNILGERIKDNYTQLYRNIGGTKGKPIPTDINVTENDYLNTSWGIPSTLPE